VNNWNYTEYIPVVPLYLIDNYVSIYCVRYDIWSKLLVSSDLDSNNTLMIVHFVDIGGIVDHQCLNFLYIIHPTRKLSHGIKL